MSEPVSLLVKPHPGGTPAKPRVFFIAGEWIRWGTDGLVETIVVEPEEIAAMIEEIPIFLTAEQLGIPETWRQGLIRTLTEMEAGRIIHRVSEEAESDQGTPRYFDMTSWCGTYACIRGWAEHLGHTIIREEAAVSLPLRDLFLPSGFASYEDVTVTHAAQAIRNYLTGGDPRWDWVLDPF